MPIVTAYVVHALNVSLDEAHSVPFELLDHPRHVPAALRRERSEVDSVQVSSVEIDVRSMREAGLNVPVVKLLHLPGL